MKTPIRVLQLLVTISPDVRVLEQMTIGRQEMLILRDRR